MSESLTGIRLIGVCITVLGADFYAKGYSGKYGVDVTKNAAIIIFCLGLCILLYSFLPKVRKQSKEADKQKRRPLFNTKQVICEKCNRTYKSSHIQVPVCPLCDGEIVHKK